jgi:hypothetical protein
VSEVIQTFSGRGAAIAWLHKGELLAKVAAAAAEAESCKNSRRVFGNMSAVLYTEEMKCLND